MTPTNLLVLLAMLAIIGAVFFALWRQEHHTARETADVKRTASIVLAALIVLGVGAVAVWGLVRL